MSYQAVTVLSLVVCFIHAAIVVTRNSRQLLPQEGLILFLIAFFIECFVIVMPVGLIAKAIMS